MASHAAHEVCRVPSRLPMYALALLTLALALFLSAPQPASGEISSDPLDLSGTSEDQVSPDIEGDTVVWQDSRHGNADIFLHNLATGSETQLTSDPSEQLRPRIGGGFVVWEDRRHGEPEIYGYDLASSTEIRLTNNPADQRNPDISGDTVVWEDNRNGRWDIYAHDLATGVEREISTSPSNKRHAAISSGMVVWQDDRGGPGRSDIYAKNLATGSEFAVSDDPPFKDQPSISDGLVVWRQENVANYDIFGRDLYAVDLETGKVFQITTDASDQVSPAVSGKLVVWTDGRDGNADIYGKNLATGEEFRISGGASPQESPAIDSETVVWEAQRTGDSTGDWDLEGVSLEVPPAPPAGLSAKGVTGGVNLSWTPNGEADLAGYEVYRASSPGGPFTLLNQDLLSRASYSDRDAPTRAISHYRIVAVDESGNRSSPAETQAMAVASTGLDLSANARSIKLGQKTTLSGTLTHDSASGPQPVSGRVVTLQRREPGVSGFTQTARAKTDASGKVRFEQSPRSTHEYRLRFAGASSAGLAPSTSPVLKVFVKAPASLTLSAPKTISHGQKTALSGRLTSGGEPVPGKRVIVEQKPVGAAKFSKAPGQPTAGLLTGSRGDFKLTGLAPKKNTDYRVRFAGARELQPAVSAGVRVGVRAKVILNVARSGSTAHIAGQVREPGEGIVTVTVRRNGTYLLSKTTSLKDSKYGFSHSLPAGSYTAKTTFRGNDANLPASSATVSFTIPG